MRLPTPADLSETSFEAARAMLDPGELPYLIVCSHLQFHTDMMAWLWNNHRITSFQIIPAEILLSPHSWCLYGERNVVISDMR